MASRQFLVNVTPAQSPRTFPDPVATPQGINVPEKFNELTFLFGNWAPAARTLAVSFEVSTDNGASWQDFGALNPFRGDATQKDGSPGASMVVTLPDTQNVNFRATATATGGQVSTTVTVTAV